LGDGGEDGELAVRLAWWREGPAEPGLRATGQVR
jgi:hypothetical protein